MRALLLSLLLTAAPAAALPAAAQTAPATSGAPAGGIEAPPGHSTRAKAPAGAAHRKSAAHATPVIAPHHTARRPVHPGAKPVLEPSRTPAPAKPAAKTASAAKPAPPAKAAPPKPVIPADEGTVTHLHLPRYASLKTDDVNMRRGPGERYPVLWTYRRRELPVRIEREFDNYRMVEDMDGVKGWVHQATLTGRRSFVVTGTEPRTLRESADPNGAPVAILKPGVVGRLRSCDAGAAWCQVEVGGYRGWLERDSFWGSDAGEAVQP